MHLCLTNLRVAVVFAIQSWLAESPAKATSATSGTSGILSVGMACEFDQSYRYNLKLMHLTVMSLIVVRQLAEKINSGSN